MNQTKNLIRLILCLIMVVCCVSIIGTTTVHAKNDKKSKKSYTYEFDKKTSTLTIKGKGEVKLSYKEFDEIYDYNEKTGKNNNSIKKIVIKEGITRIGGYAFDDIYELESVELPKSLEEIGAGAFSYTGLKSIEIPKNVEIIDNYAFSNCRKLKDVKFAAGSKCTSIYNYAFSCTKISSLTIPAKVSTLGYSAFAGCSKLETVTIKGKTTGSEAFTNCDKLKKISLGHNISVINNNAFCDLNVEEVILSNSIKLIGKNAFKNCWNLKTIKLPNKLTTIDKEAFMHSGITEITIPDSVTTIGKRAFYECNSLISVKLSNSLTTIKEETFSSCGDLDNVEFGAGISYIQDSAFEDCKLTTLVIPASVVEMGYKAFYRCKITNLTLSEGLTSIGDWNFAENTYINAVVIPSTVSVIEENAFSGCTSMVSYTVSEYNAYYMSKNGMLLTKDGEKLFACPATAEVVEIPATVKRFAEYAFSGCNRVREYRVEEGNTSYTAIDGILYDVTGTCLVRFPQSITGVVAISNTTTSIASNAFSGCAITSAVIPYSVTELGAGCFEECVNLTSITVPGSVRVIPVSAFWGDVNLKVVKLENGVELIRRNAFYNCTALKTIRIANSVKSINATAFSECNFSQLTFYCSKKSAALVFAEKNFINYRIV